MGTIALPHPVKLFVGMLARDDALLDDLRAVLENAYGNVDVESPVWPWEHTKYYENEMGPGLKRQFIFFEKLIGPEEIAGIKLTTDGLEKQFLDEYGGRQINLDPGYLDAAKIVLASTKDFSHRIYLDRGIYGEVTLLYAGGDYRSLPYTFPDYKTGKYLELFRTAREIYKKQMKERTS